MCEAEPLGRARVSVQLCSLTVAVHLLCSALHRHMYVSALVFASVCVRFRPAAWLA